MQLVTEEHVRQRVKLLVDRTKSDLGLQVPPKYLGTDDPVAKHLGIIVREKDLPLDEGQYIPSHRTNNNIPIIAIDTQNVDIDRKNFTFFHEVTHHLIRNDGELYSFLHEYASINNLAFELSLETLCNIGAAEFLIPSSDIHEMIDKQGFNIELIRYFDQKYPASKPAIAIQLAQCAKHECFIVVCDFGFPPDQSTSQLSLVTDQIPKKTVLFVQYSASSRYDRKGRPTKYRIGRYIPIPKNHILSNCYNKQKLIKGKDTIPFKSKTHWVVDCEAVYYLGKVYATFNVSPPTQSSTIQPRLL